MCSSCSTCEDRMEKRSIERDRRLSKILEKTSDMRSTICKSFYDEKSSFKPLTIDHFELKKVIGKGSSGTVYMAKLKFLPKTLALHNNRDELFAIKIVEKKILIAKHLQECLLNEKYILQHNECPFLAKLVFSFQSPTKLFFGMEYLSGGDLFFHLSKGVTLSENALRFYCAEIILGIEYLHMNNIIYRDLKPENLIFDQNGHIKLVDFGLSKFLKKFEPKTSNTYCGTPEYVAPEIICSHIYDKSVDWWSLGTILYEILHKVPPFYDIDHEVMFRRIAEEELVFKIDCSDSFRDFVERLLEKKPSKRLGGNFKDARELKEHSFFNDFKWKDIETMSLKPPFLPFISPTEEATNFDTELTNQSPKIQDSIYEGSHYNHFQDFSYTKANDRK